MVERKQIEPTEQLEAWLGDYRKHGYVTLEGVLNPAELSQVREALNALLEESPQGRNHFEGVDTKRVYTLVARGQIFEWLTEHPTIMALIDQLLLPGFLLTASQAICIAPGETPQPVHTDDSFYPIPRPRPAVSVSTMWAIEDFTEDNGATEVIPGSHLWDDEQVRHTYFKDDSLPLAPEYAPLLKTLVMPAGSCTVFAGTLIHRGGPNRSQAVRTAISNQYCEPWARQQENFFLSIPKQKVSRMTPRLQEMLGYSIYGPFMGQVTARHPQKVLTSDFENPLED